MNTLSYLFEQACECFVTSVTLAVYCMFLRLSVLSELACSVHKYFVNDRNSNCLAQMTKHDFDGVCAYISRVTTSKVKVIVGLTLLTFQLA